MTFNTLFSPASKFYKYNLHHVIVKSRFLYTHILKDYKNKYFQIYEKNNEITKIVKLKKSANRKNNKGPQFI